MNSTLISAIKPDDQVSGVFRVVEVRLAPYRDGSKGHYLHLTLADRSGQVEARVWEHADETAAWLAAGDMVKLTARATLYQDHIRLRVSQIEAVADAAGLASELVATPAEDVADAWAEIEEAVARVHEPALRDLLAGVFGDGEFAQAFALAPVERPGRLLRRTLSLLALAEPLRREAPDLDHDLLTAALLLHAAGETAGLRGGAASRSLTWLGVAQLSDDLIVERLTQRPAFPADLALRLRDAVRYARQPSAGHTREAAALAALIALHEAIEF